MDMLLEWYGNQNVNTSVLAEFHARYESIHPFQDDDVIIRTKLEKPSKIKNPNCSYIKILSKFLE